MKLLKILAITSLLAISGQSFANTTIQFPQGSYCSSFSGNVVGRKFDIFLGTNQTLTITPDADFDIVVKDPKGKTLHSNDYDEWTTKNKGKHTIILRGNNKFADVEFCAY